jgi:RND family efflux transporter MFP subunit
MNSLYEREKMNKLFPLILTVLIFGVAFPALIYAQGHAAPVKVKDVEIRNTQKRQVVTGNLRAVKRSKVACKEPGSLSVVNAKEGQFVSRGDVLAEVDSKRLALEVKQATLNIARALAVQDQMKAELVNYKDELSRRLAAKKIAHGAVSDEAIQGAKTKIDVAQAALQTAKQDHLIAKAQLELFQIRLEDTKVRAPFDGIVVKKHIEVGEWINPGDSVVTLISRGKLEVEFEIPEQFSIDILRKITTLTIDVKDRSIQIDANEIRIIPDVNPRSRRFKLIAVVSPKEVKLAPGMSVTAAIPTKEKKDYLIVPSNAVLRDSGGEFVYKIVKGRDGNLSAMAVPLHSLFTINNELAVTSQGLKKGDQLVVDGNERLRPMSPVMILQEKSK